MAKNTTGWTTVSKNSTGWGVPSKNTTGWNYGSGAVFSGVTIGDLTIQLNSSTQNLLGYTAGTHYYDNKNNTNWTQVI